MLSSQINKRIGQAMHDYSMLSEGDNILVAVSGGIDSLVLVWLLQYWQKKAPIQYELHAVHIDMGIWNKDMAESNPVEIIEQQVKKTGLSLTIEKSFPLPKKNRSCFSCSITKMI